jgi:dipeptidyl aminopeptidase/acylaminoacyl peptidase
MGPTLIIHGTADIVVPYTYSIHFNEVIRYSHLCLLQGMDHGYSGHMAEPASLATRFLTKELK